MIPDVSGDGHELLPGVRVDVGETVRKYCDVDRLAYRYFDSINPDTPPGDLEPADLWIANNLNARIQLATFAALWERVEANRSEIRQRLGEIPRAEQLWCADDETLRAAGRLLDVLCGPRAYGPTVTKILHKKRPDLFPIIDSRVRPMFERVVPSVAGRTWAEYMVEVKRVIGPWIVRNRSELEEARAPHDRLTTLRAYDICLWTYATAAQRSRGDG
jgi:hypothetical protein